MSEGQKQRIEKLHNTIQEAMIKKARLTIIARDAIIKGNKPDDTLLRELHSIDQYISGLYYQEINEVKKFAKKIRGSVMTNDLVRSEIAQRLYRDDTMIDKGDLEFYNTLLQELHQVKKEQTALYFYINKDSKRKTTNTELEKNLRASILSMQNMQGVIPALKETLYIELDRVGRELDSTKTKRDFIEIDIESRESRPGSHRNKTLGNEKKAVRELNNNIENLTANVADVETIVAGTSKTEAEMNTETHDSRERITAERKAKEDEIKAARRKANEDRRKANEDRRKANEEEKVRESISPTNTVPEPTKFKIIKNEKPKNKFSLKKLLKTVIPLILVTVALYTGLFFLTSVKKNSSISTNTSTAVSTITNNQELKDDNITIVPNEEEQVIENEEEQVIENEEEQVIENEEEQEHVIKLDDKVTINNNKIYSDIYSAVNDENAKTPYFNADKEYTIAKMIVITKDGVRKTIYANKAGKEKFKNLEPEFTIVGYAVTTRPSVESMTDAQIDNSGIITGYVTETGINLVNTNSNGRGGRR